MLLSRLRCVGGLQMVATKVPNSDHVSRLCGASKCDEDGRPLGEAFMLRDSDSYLSVNWLERTGASSRAKQLEEVRRHLTNKDVRLPARGRLAVLHLQTLVDYVQSESVDGRVLWALHEPEFPHDPSHSGIYGYTAEEQAIADLIAKSDQDVYPAQG